MIGLNDFRRDPPELVAAEETAFRRVRASGWFILGHEVEEFESAWARICGTRHAVGVGNGLDALEIGLRAVGIGPGDEVVTTPMTAFATVLAILRAGAVPVLADIEPETGLLCPDSVSRCLGPKTRAILLVHLYGQLRNVAAWQNFCQTRGLLLLEDCAQAHLAQENGQPAGGFGAWGGYSFYPTKNLGAIGDAGALVTNRPEVAEQARILRHYGQRQRYEHLARGLNSRLDELQAAILSARLPFVSTWNDRRREISRSYTARLSNPGVHLLAPPLAPENHVHHLFVVRCRAREAFARELLAQGIETQSHYPVPAHRQPAGAGIRCDPHGLPAAEKFARECLSLPCHPHLTDSEVEFIIATINRTPVPEGAQTESPAPSAGTRVEERRP